MAAEGRGENPRGQDGREEEQRAQRLRPGIRASGGDHDQEGEEQRDCIRGCEHIADALALAPREVGDAARTNRMRLERELTVLLLDERRYGRPLLVAPADATQ